MGKKSHILLDRRREKIYHANGKTTYSLGKEGNDMQDVFERMKKIIAEQFSTDEDEITMDTSFEGDLGADSVDLVELVMSMEEEFDIGEVQEEDLTGLSTVGDCVNYVNGKLD